MLEGGTLVIKWQLETNMNLNKIVNAKIRKMSTSL